MPPQDNPQDQSTNFNPQPSYGADQPAAPAEQTTPAVPDFSAPAMPAAEPTSPYAPPAAAPDFSAPVAPPAEPVDPMAPPAEPTAGSDISSTPGPVVG